MKRILYILCIFTFAMQSEIKACFGGDDEYYDEYSSWFFSSYIEEYSFFDKNEPSKGNIQEWANYLGISYDDAKYLVFKSKKYDIEASINGYPTDENLKFLTKDFIKKHRKALQYIICAKNLEPYASTGTTNSYYYDPEYFAWLYEYEEHSVDELNYEETINMLQECCESETDEELRLRYAYQLIRFAHYSRHYDEAINYFDKYVGKISNKPELYYYALCQKAGAEFNLDKNNDAIKHYIDAFCHSTDMKEIAYRSIFTFCGSNISINSLMKFATSQEDKNNVYLMLGFSDFSNPLEVAKKIIEQDPEAPQARKLIAKQISQLEEYHQNHSKDTEITLESNSDFMFPAKNNTYSETIDFLIKMTKSSVNVDFWNMTLAYVYFLNSDYENTKAALSKVSNEIKEQSKDIQNIYAYIDICQIKKMTPQIENDIFDKYKNFFSYDFENPALYDISKYLCKVIANRYYINKDYAKAYLMTNSVYSLTEYIPINVIESIHDLLLKENKNQMEKWMLDKYGEINDNAYDTMIEDVELIDEKAAIAVGDIKKALEINKKYNINDDVDVRMFAHNISHVYGFYGLHNDYIDNFISGGSASLSASLNKLYEIASDSSENASIANYLLGNFFYNVSCVGPCRNYLKGFSSPDYYCSEYEWYENKSNEFHFNFDEKLPSQVQVFDSYNVGSYHNTIELAQKYYNNAFEKTNDDELKAHIIFGKAKCEKAITENTNWNYQYYSPYFNDLLNYKHTNYYNEVMHGCSYFYDFTF